MLNFTVGPVQSSEIVCSVGGEQVPYFRTPEFSETMFENEKLVKEFAHAPEASRVVFLTGSGTASMEAAVMNIFDKRDKLLVVNGGSFGTRFAEICRIHEISYEEIKLETGKTLTADDLSGFAHKGFTGFLVNVHETSTGVHYDMKLIGDFCRENNLFLVVDAISSFLADEFDMSANGAQVMIAGSQKALACPPGISLLVLSPEALRRIEERETKCLYLNLKLALRDGERGQTPFTPAVGILRQINARLKEIAQCGGAESEIEKVSGIAKDFRARLEGLPFEICSNSLSNAVTPLHPKTASAYEIFKVLKDEYQIWVCPNGGALADKIFRVGHIGALTTKDNETLIAAFHDMKQCGLI